LHPFLSGQIGLVDVISQQYRPEFTANHIRRFAAQMVQIQRLFNRKQIKLGMSSIAIQSTYFISGIFLVVKKRGNYIERLGLIFCRGIKRNYTDLDLFR